MCHKAKNDVFLHLFNGNLSYFATGADTADMSASRAPSSSQSVAAQDGLLNIAAKIDAAIRPKKRHILVFILITQNTANKLREHV